MMRDDGVDTADLDGGWAAPSLARDALDLDRNVP
jgi:hypothetical protein